MDVDLVNAPARIKSLKLCPVRAIPVPWFVAWIDGVPEFRVAEPEKRMLALRDRLCWVCGEKMGKRITFLIGPMCGINHTTAEPGCHKDCATWSAQNCPFLSKPQMVRRENDMPESVSPGGHMIARNPGVMLLWTTLGFRLFGDGRGGLLVEVGPPLEVGFWRLGRAATRAEIEESVRTGLPALEAMAAQEEGGLAELARRHAEFVKLYPAAS